MFTAKQLRERRQRRQQGQGRIHAIKVEDYEPVDDNTNKNATEALGYDPAVFHFYKHKDESRRGLLTNKVVHVLCN